MARLAKKVVRGSALPYSGVFTSCDLEEIKKLEAEKTHDQFTRYIAQITEVTASTERLAQFVEWLIETGHALFVSEKFLLYTFHSLIHRPDIVEKLVYISSLASVKVDFVQDLLVFCSQKAERYYIVNLAVAAVMLSVKTYVWALENFDNPVFMDIIKNALFRQGLSDEKIERCMIFTGKKAPREPGGWVDIFILRKFPWKPEYVKFAQTPYQVRVTILRNTELLGDTIDELAGRLDEEQRKKLAGELVNSEQENFHTALRLDPQYKFDGSQLWTLTREHVIKKDPKLIMDAILLRIVDRFPREYADEALSFLLQFSTSASEVEPYLRLLGEVSFDKLVRDQERWLNHPPIHKVASAYATTNLRQYMKKVLSRSWTAKLLSLDTPVRHRISRGPILTQNIMLDGEEYRILDDENSDDDDEDSEGIVMRIGGPRVSFECATRPAVPAPPESVPPSSCSIQLVDSKLYQRPTLKFNEYICEKCHLADDKVVACPACLEEIPLVILSCGHAICSECIQKVAGRACPTCRVRFDERFAVGDVVDRFLSRVV